MNDRSSGRIDAIPTLPIFYKLDGRSVLLGGGGEPAVWKAELLVAAGARVIVCDADPCEAMSTLAEDAAGGTVELNRRPWQDADFVGVALAIGALTGEAAVDFHSAARRAGVTVNIVDNPGLCDFQFGTIVARSPLLIAISTDGAAPVLGQSLRTRIEALLPASIGAWARAAKDWRPGLQRRNLGFAGRRRFWETFADRALDGSGRDPAESDRLACLDAALTAEATRTGSIDLVGLGPGAPDLVTLRAVRGLQSADIVIHDRTVDPSILALGRREAERITMPIEPGKLLSLLTASLEAKKRIAIAAPGNPDGCGRWHEIRSEVSQFSVMVKVVEGLPCLGCTPTCGLMQTGLNVPP